MMAPDAASVVPMFTPLLQGEPVPERGRIRASVLDRPGFGVELDRSLPLERPFAR
jgi:L-rhamnonate dehydratase